MVLPALALGPGANPVIVPTIDKARQRSGQDPLAPLHGRLERLTPFSPREQRQALESAIARTVAQGRTVMAVDDLPLPVATQRRRIGFVWTD